MKAADFVSEYKISRFLDMCIEKFNRAEAAPAGGGLSPLGENSRAQKRRPTPIEICPLKAVCR